MAGVTALVLHVGHASTSNGPDFALLGVDGLAAFPAPGLAGAPTLRWGLKTDAGEPGLTCSVFTFSERGVGFSRVATPPKGKLLWQLGQVRWRGWQSL